MIADKTTTVSIDERAVLWAAKGAIIHLREIADSLRYFTKINARDPWLRCCHREVQSLKPLIQAAVKMYGADLFRRKPSPGGSR